MVLYPIVRTGGYVTFYFAHFCPHLPTWANLNLKKQVFCGQSGQKVGKTWAKIQEYEKKIPDNPMKQVFHH